MKIVTLGEVMLRLSPPANERFVQADTFGACYGGAEANVAVMLAQLGAKTEFVTKLPENELGQAALNSLRRWGVGTEYIVRGDGRLGVYYLERGASQRAGKVIYDRAGSAFAVSSAEEYDESVFEGADWFHFTGITPALGENCLALVQKACRAAKKHGATVSCDINYRATLWPLERAKEAMKKLMADIDVCISNAFQAEQIFDLHAQGAGDEHDEALARMLAETYGLRTVALTRRKSVTANENFFSGMLWQDKAYFSREYDMKIVDRVGGGDAFAGGLIYALAGKESGQSAIEFATAAGCFKHSVEGDVCLACEQEIRALAQGAADGRVSR